jgi:prevent-host-death family protein
MKVAPVADVKARLSEYLTVCQEEAVIVTRNGRPTALLVGIREGDDLEQMVLVQSPRFRRLLEEAERRAGGAAGVAHDAFWQQLEGKRRARPTRRRRKRRA